MAAAAGVSLLLALLMTLDTALWYERFGWIRDDGRPVRRTLHDPALDWLRLHPDVTHVFGGYWDVYRLTFLTSGRVKGVPYPVFPNRYPEWSSGLPGGRPEVLIARPTPEGYLYRNQAVQQGAKSALATPEVAIYLWPRRRERGTR
jgi:hypothetical protein